MAAMTRAEDTTDIVHQGDTTGPDVVEHLQLEKMMKVGELYSESRIDMDARMCFNNGEIHDI